MEPTEAKTLGGHVLLCALCDTPLKFDLHPDGFACVMPCDGHRSFDIEAAALERAAECVDSYATEQGSQPAAKGETAIAYALRSVAAGLLVAGGRIRSLKGKP